ncbi:hypothetical protein AGDE_15224 [Angomonas deanei]|uniref:COG4 transport protein, putative n=1 Tax=Angomonas deanei TaxID=59799 RepID=A0A7G2CRM8_9TRYP|nr:hypothetical protein AGDE_15224 [Angomonas deanei]CAD2222456.1 COG4 transport protein, putative [Angomonas deanei]|eukprot:EPY19458.1 hypothetical protein AGDE_15224 [Angomonas deanei]
MSCLIKSSHIYDYLLLLFPLSLFKAEKIKSYYYYLLNFKKKKMTNPLDRLQPVPDLQRRVENTLQDIMTRTQRRNQLLLEATDIVHDYNSNNNNVLKGTLEEIQTIRHHTTPEIVKAVVTLSKAVQSSAVTIDKNTQNVKLLETLLKRVESVRQVVRMIEEMEDSAACISSHMKQMGGTSTEGTSSKESGPATDITFSEEELEKMVKLICSYQRAKTVVRGDHGTIPTEEEESIALAKDKAKTQLEAVIQQITEDSYVNDTANVTNQNSRKITLRWAVSLLMSLGEEVEARDKYVHYITSHTETSMRGLVEEELEKMKSVLTSASSGAAITTHLVLVSQCLDMVAAVFEEEEEFLFKQFHSFGVLSLLSRLHNKTTEQCIPVLSHFVETRKLFFDASSTNKMDVRQMDQILEEMSHIISCCHCYFYFIESKVEQYKHSFAAELCAKEEEEGRRGSATGDTLKHQNSNNSFAVLDSKQEEEKENARKELINTVYRQKVEEQLKSHQLFQHDATSTPKKMNTNKDPPLLTAVQEILTLYVPLQNQYYTEAFTQAVYLQQKQIADVEERRKEQQQQQLAKGGAAAPLKDPSSMLLSGLNSIYTEITAAVQVSSGGDDEGGEVAAYNSANLVSSAAEEDYYRSLVSHRVAASKPIGRRVGGNRVMTTNNNNNSNSGITLVDDVFFFLRVSFRRSMQTKEIQISSAVVLGALDVLLRELYYPEIRSHIERRPRKYFDPSSHRPVGKMEDLERRLTVMVQEGAAALHEGKKPLSSDLAALQAMKKQKQLSARALVWLAALETSIEYTRKLAIELRELALSFYQDDNPDTKTNPPNKNKNVLRFQEMSGDLDILAKEHQTDILENYYLKGLAQCSFKMVMTSIIKEHVVPLSYVLGEEEFFQREMHDPWVQRCIQAWRQFFIEQVKPFFNLELEEGDTAASSSKGAVLCWNGLIRHLIIIMVQQLKEILLKKEFNGFGGLQIDREIRQLKTFFLQQSDVLNLRELFCSINLIVSLVLADTPQSALDEIKNQSSHGNNNNNNLTVEEKRRILLNRVDFDKEEVKRLVIQ